MGRWSTLKAGARSRHQIVGVDSGFFFAIISADLPRSLLIGIAPLILSALVIDRGFGEKLAAWISSAELLSAALSAIAVSGWVARVSKRRIARFGLFLVVVAQLTSVFRIEFIPLLGLRVLVGAGAGLAGAASTAAAAGTRNPERVFGAVGFVVALVGALTAGPIGMAIEAFGATGAFLFASALSAAAFLFLGKLDDPASTSEAMEDLVTHTRNGSNTFPALMILIPLFINMLGQNAVWSFTVQIGLTTGLAISQVSWVLALTALTGLGGAALASTLNIRKGRTGPLLLSLAGTAISVYALVESTTPLPYIIANGAWSFFFAFSMPYFIGALAYLDAGGRWAAIGVGLAGVGGALGPAVTGGLVESYGYLVLRTVVLATALISTVMLIPVLTRIDRGAFD